MIPIRIRFLILLGAACMPSAIASGGEPPVLNRIAEIRSLTREEATKALPARIRGVVIWQSPGSFVIHDGERGIYVDTLTAKERGIWKSGDPSMTETQVGAVIEMEGISDPGGYAPTVLPRSIKRVGSGALPLRYGVALRCRRRFINRVPGSDAAETQRGPWSRHRRPPPG